MEKRELAISDRNRKRLFWTIASIVVFVTTYMLVLPALTFDEETAIEDPAVSNETLSQDKVNELETLPDPFVIEEEREAALNNSDSPVTDVSEEVSDKADGTAVIEAENKDEATDSSTVDSFDAQNNTETQEVIENNNTEVTPSEEEGSLSVSPDDKIPAVLEVNNESNDISQYATAETEVQETTFLMADGNTLIVSIIPDESEDLSDDAKIEVNEIQFGDPEWNSRSVQLASALFKNYGNVTISDARFLSIKITLDGKEYKLKNPAEIKVEYKDVLVTEDMEEYGFDEETGIELRPEPEEQISHFAAISYTDDGAEFLASSNADGTDAERIEESTFKTKTISSIDIVYVYEYTAPLAD